MGSSARGRAASAVPHQPPVLARRYLRTLMADRRLARRFD